MRGLLLIDSLLEFTSPWTYIHLIWDTKCYNSLKEIYLHNKSLILWGKRDHVAIEKSLYLYINSNISYGYTLQ